MKTGHASKCDLFLIMGDSYVVVIVYTDATVCKTCAWQVE